jgi:anti-anti-sigma factor
VSHFGVTSRHEDGRLVVAPTGELDIAAVEAMRAELADRAHGEDVTIDLRGVEFLDTSGIQVVVEAWRNAREDGFTLRLIRAEPRVHRVFEISGLDGVLPFFGDA